LVNEAATHARKAVARLFKKKAPTIDRRVSSSAHRPPRDRRAADSNPIQSSPQIMLYLCLGTSISQFGVWRLKIAPQGRSAAASA